MGDVIAARKSATLPPQLRLPRLLYFLVSDPNNIWYTVRRKKKILPAWRKPHLENCIGSKPHQTAQPPGDCRKVSSEV